MNKGFTLIELSIVVVIVGILLAGAMQALKAERTLQAYTQTKEYHEEVEDALISFLLENERLPCPASLTAPPNTPEYGREVSSNCTSGSHAGTFRATGRGGRQIRMGAIPTRTLNISDEYGLDGWNNRILYAVVERLADEDIPFDPDAGAIQVVDMDNNSVITPGGSALYVIVSHGRSGNGAYTYEGVRFQNTGCDPSTRDGQNCNMSNRFRTGDLATVRNNRRFDNIVTYSGKMSALRCAEGQVVIGLHPNGTPLCGRPFAGVRCPSGHAIEGFDENGDLLCVNVEDRGSICLPGVTECRCGTQVLCDVHGQGCAWVCGAGP